MTALSLELMDITRNWFSSFVMLCQAFTAADFSCCLWVFLPLVLSSESEMLLNQVEIRRLTQPLQNIPHFLPSKTSGLLLLYVLGHRPFVL